MAPITSDCDAIRTHQHQMAVITSECDLGQMPGAMAELKANLTDDSPVREHLSSPPSVNTCHRVSSSLRFGCGTEEMVDPCAVCLPAVISCACACNVPVPMRRSASVLSSTHIQAWR